MTILWSPRGILEPLWIYPETRPPHTKVWIVDFKSTATDNWINIAFLLVLMFSVISDIRAWESSASASSSRLKQPSIPALLRLVFSHLWLPVDLTVEAADVSPLDACFPFDGQCCHQFVCFVCLFVSEEVAVATAASASLAANSGDRCWHFSGLYPLPKLLQKAAIGSNQNVRDTLLSDQLKMESFACCPTWADDWSESLGSIGDWMSALLSPYHRPTLSGDGVKHFLLLRTCEITLKRTRFPSVFSPSQSICLMLARKQAAQIRSPGGTLWGASENTPSCFSRIQHPENRYLEEIISFNHLLMTTASVLFCLFGYSKQIFMKTKENMAMLCNIPIWHKEYYNWWK